jgi:hypothetical protein
LNVIVVNLFAQLEQSLKMNKHIKSMLNAATVVWVIMLYLNAGQPAPPTADVLQTWQRSLDRLLQTQPMTIGTTGLTPTIASYPD